MNTHNTSSSLTRDWVKFGVLYGFLALFAYLSRFMPLPEGILLMGYFFFGPCLILFSISLYYLVQHYRPSALSGSFLALNAMSGVAVAMMFVVQNLNRHQYQILRDSESANFTAEQIRELMTAVFGVQAGIGMVWDIFIFTGTAILAIALILIPRLPMRIVGMLGLPIALAGLGFNFYAWPEVNPISIGLPDVGPIVGGWYGLVYTLHVWAYFRDRDALGDAR